MLRRCFALLLAWPSVMLPKHLQPRMRLKQSPAEDRNSLSLASLNGRPLDICVVDGGPGSVRRHRCFRSSMEFKWEAWVTANCGPRVMLISSGAFATNESGGYGRWPDKGVGLVLDKCSWPALALAHWSLNRPFKTGQAQPQQQASWSCGKPPLHRPRVCPTGWAL